jgi:uncharacterized lipoprotein
MERDVLLKQVRKQLSATLFQTFSPTYTLLRDQRSEAAHRSVVMTAVYMQTDALIRISHQYSVPMPILEAPPHHGQVSLPKVLENLGIHVRDLGENRAGLVARCRNRSASPLKRFWIDSRISVVSDT